MQAAAIVDELKGLGDEKYKTILLKHGVKEPCFGVKIADMKKICKRVKTDYQLALDLYDTGISDAMYFAGLIADDAAMTATDLKRWVKKANSPLISEYTVPWVAAGSPKGWDLAKEWIESKHESIASAGWSTFSSMVATKDDSKFDLAELRLLLHRVEKSIHKQPNRVRYCMNGFLIAVGSYVQSLSNLALETAEKNGAVVIEINGTACNIPFAPDRIKKVQTSGSVGKKRKPAKC